MTSKHTPSNRETVARRRQHVAALRLRGYTIDEIHAALGASPETRNHNTGRPWARSIIGRDLAALDGEWKERAAEDVADRKAFYGAKLDELQKQAWRNNSLSLVLKTMEREAKLYGLDAPTKVAPTTPDGLGEYNGGRDSDEEATEKVASIIQSIGLLPKVHPNGAARQEEAGDVG